MHGQDCTNPTCHSSLSPCPRTPSQCLPPPCSFTDSHLPPTHSVPRPLILDPADPTWNVGLGSWELLAQEAAALETRACFLGTDGTAVQPWDVLVRRCGCPVPDPLSLPEPHPRPLGVLAA